MNLNQLKYFCTVCLFQTVSDAAEYLHISQPSLSGAIKDLENEFGVRIEDVICVTNEGYENFTKSSKELIIL